MSLSRSNKGSNFDTNLENYSHEDLMTLFDIEPHHSVEDATKRSNDYLEALENEHPEIIEFLRNAQNRVLETHNLRIEQGVKNPIKRETNYKYLMIDSRFRQNNNIIENQSILNPVSEAELIAQNSQTANFVLNFSETLKNVTKLKFFSAHIPFCWYNVYEPINRINIQVDTDPVIQVALTPGNYVLNNDLTDDQNLIKALNDKLGAIVKFFYNIVSGKVEMQNQETKPVTIFFTITIESTCNEEMKINKNIGTMLGFKKTSYTFNPSQIIFAEGFPDIRRTKYLIIEIDDFNKNYLANKLVYGTNRNETLSLPDYYTPLRSQNVPESSINGVCVDDNLKYSGIFNEPGTTTNNPVPLYNESYPRTMTQNQIYSLNELLKARANKKSVTKLFNASPNYFAFIPVDISGQNLVFGDILIYENDTETLNERIYFGPIDIERINVRILDDTGEQLDLNGAEWSMMVIVEHLYQY